MKKLLSLFILSLLLTIVVTAQANLYRGIRSGITTDQYLKYCTNHPAMDVNIYDNTIIVTTELAGNIYFIMPYYNKTGRLSNICIKNLTMYSLEDGKDVAHNVLGLSHMFEMYMGESIYRESISLLDINDDVIAPVIMHRKESVDAFISITKSKNKYYVEMSILDTSFFLGLN